MVNVYYDKDADLNLLQDKQLAVIGYGAQGRAQACNLKDSGLNVIVGLRENSKSKSIVESDGLKSCPVAEAVKKADLVQMLIPDDQQAKVYAAEVGPNLKDKAILMFSHGFNIHFKQILPPDKVDVIMVAPKSPGKLLRRMFTDGKGVPCLIAVHQDASGKAKDYALAYAKALGGTRAGTLETTFKEETETDLFGEQVVLCGGVTELIRGSFDTLVDAGYQPEIAYFECLNELKLIVDLIYEGGMTKMYNSVSLTAQYGDLTRGPRIINQKTRQEMKNILKEVQNGKFAQEWIKENEVGRPNFEKLRTQAKSHAIEKVGEKLRAMMSWLQT